MLLKNILFPVLFMKITHFSLARINHQLDPSHGTAHNVNGYYSQIINEQYMEQHVQMPPQTNSLPLSLSHHTNKQEIQLHKIAFPVLMRQNRI